MKRLLVLVSIVFLTACGSAAPESPTAVTPAAETPAIEMPAEQVDAAAASVAEAAVLRSSDWTKGAADPSVVLIEYGDFQ